VTKTPEGFYEVNTRPHGSQMKVVALVDPPGRVLDVGCSTGYLAERLQKRGSTVIGIDMDERAAELARRFCEAVYVGDIETMELPFEPGSFDAVVCGDLIEHLRAPQAVLARLRPLLRPGGRLVLSTPNIANWAMRLGLLFGRFRYTDWGILARTHTHLFTRKTLRECLESAGYRVEVFDYTVPVPVLSTPRVEGLAHRVGRLRPSLLAYQFVVAAVPAHEQVTDGHGAEHPGERQSPARVRPSGREG
jgi:O-antigen biosynthesis protein